MCVCVSVSLADYYGTSKAQAKCGHHSYDAMSTLSLSVSTCGNGNQTNDIAFF